MNAPHPASRPRKLSLFAFVLTGALFLVACANDEPIVDGDNDDGDTVPAATVEISSTGAPGSDGVSGAVTITQEGDNALNLSGTLSGLSEGEHGFHLHAEGSCEEADSDDDGEMEPAGAAGPHYDADPGADSLHAGPTDTPEERHFGDFGNVTANADGEASIDINVDRPEGISFDTDVVGRALIVHEGEDDLESDPGGNSGTRFGCGVISSN